jgi:hypothetical protein
MFAELVRPEVVIGTGLSDPVLVHVCEKIVFAKGTEESANARALVRRDDGTIG